MVSVGSSNHSHLSGSVSQRSPLSEKSKVVQSEQGTLRSSFQSKDSDESKQQKKIQFKDFDIIEVIGEGSFGRVYKGKKKDDGQIFALKVMKKQDLLSKNQVKYALSEA